MNSYNLLKISLKNKLRIILRGKTDRPNKCHCPNEHIRYHHPLEPYMDNGREAIKRAFNIPNGYKSAKRPFGSPSKAYIV